MIDEPQSSSRWLNRQPQYQPNARVAHTTVAIDESLYLWCGNQPGLPSEHCSPEKRRLTSHVQVFSFSSGEWATHITKGIPPLGTRGYTCSAVTDKLYYFGGYCGHDNCFHNSVNQLDTSSLTWTELEPTAIDRPVMRRGYGGMVTIEHAGVHQLLMVGGEGSPPTTQLPQADYSERSNGNWHTNEHSLYNISTGKWSSPFITGQCILPGSGFVTEKINNSRAIVFGGAVNEDTASNSVYLMEISASTVYWQRLNKPAYQWPVGRYLHAATIITGSVSPILVTIGGWDQNKQTLNECWLFNITSCSWTKISLPDTVSERYFHSLSAFVMGPHRIWILIIGGKDKKRELIKVLNNTMLIELVLTKSVQWSVGDILNSSDLTYLYKQKYQQFKSERKEWLEKYQKPIAELERTNQALMRDLQQTDREKRDAHQQLKKKERVLQEKERELQLSHRQLEENETEKEREVQEKARALQLLQEKERVLQQVNQQLEDSQQEKTRVLQQLQEIERELQKKERKLQFSHQQLEENEKEKDREVQEKARALQQLQEIERELQEKEREFQLSQQQLEESERAFQVSSQQLQGKERELCLSQKTVHIYQQQVQSQQNHWVIQRDEVILTGQLLGKGSYGHVGVGVFRGLRVAVKSLHDFIISDYNLALFTREMDIASRARHPNLVQFIGATKVGSLLIVTELMSTSLYHELQKKALTQPQIVSIGRDVALGLNYLHLWKPKPIIHRDVSSPNVLLESSVSAGFFKAKLTDYGTANLQQYTHTKMPGNPVYAAPESLNPSDHSPSMDIYSYCVLLMEMSLHRPPAWTVEERAQQVVLLSWDTMKFLVQSGLNIDHTARPTMAQILNTLNGL